MWPTVAEAPRPTNAGDHAIDTGEATDGACVGLGPSIALLGGEPMQILRASAVALPFVGLAVLVAMLSTLVAVAK
jgi:hypothetical protein